MQKTIHSDEHTALRNLLTAARQKSDLTQADLAARLEMPQSFVSKVERGERLLDVIEFSRYASALGLDPLEAFSELLRRVGHPAAAKKTNRPTKQTRGKQRASAER